MKVISLLQPFASLVALGAKRIETRKRNFTGGYRGPVAIHASRGKDYMDLCHEEPFLTALRPILGGMVIGDPSKILPFGAIVAVCDLVDVRLAVRIEDSRYSTDHLIASWLGAVWGTSIITTAEIEKERAFGDYSPGRYLYLLSNVVAMDKPIPARGQLGLWNFEMEDPRGGTRRV